MLESGENYLNGLSETRAAEAGLRVRQGYARVPANENAPRRFRRGALRSGQIAAQPSSAKYLMVRTIWLV